jgi:hypothetical protein
MYMDENYIKKVNQTYSKSYSKRQSLPKFIINEPVPDDVYVLDYGAGKDIYGTYILRSYFTNVIAYDIGKNFVEGLHDIHALDDDRGYDIIMMSNVINIQPSIRDIVNVLCESKEYLTNYGSVYCNLPAAPIKCDIDKNILKILMKGIFEEVYVHKNNIFEGEKVC